MGCHLSSFFFILREGNPSRGVRVENSGRLNSARSSGESDSTWSRMLDRLSLELDEQRLEGFVVGGAAGPLQLIDQLIDLWLHDELLFRGVRVSRSRHTCSPVC